MKAAVDFGQQYCSRCKGSTGSRGGEGGEFVFIECRDCCIFGRVCVKLPEQGTSVEFDSALVVRVLRVFRLPIQQIQRMRNQVGDRLQRFHCAAGTAR